MKLIKLTSKPDIINGPMYMKVCTKAL